MKPIGRGRNDSPRIAAQQETMLPKLNRGELLEITRNSRSVPAFRRVRFQEICLVVGRFRVSAAFQVQQFNFSEVLYVVLQQTF
jgi:hypothetical protein